MFFKAMSFFRLVDFREVEPISYNFETMMQTYVLLISFGGVYCEL